MLRHENQGGVVFPRKVLCPKVPFAVRIHEVGCAAKSANRRSAVEGL